MDGKEDIPTFSTIYIVGETCEALGVPATPGRRLADADGVCVDPPAGSGSAVGCPCMWTGTTWIVAPPCGDTDSDTATDSGRSSNSEEDDSESALYESVSEESVSEESVSEESVSEKSVSE